MHIRDPVETDLPYRPELQDDERSMLIEWAVQKKFGGDIIARGTDPDYPGSTFWELRAPIRIVSWPFQQRLWATHMRNPGDDAARILRFLQEVIATHPPTRH